MRACQIRRTAQTELWANVKPGSLYGALHRISTEQEGKRPARAHHACGAHVGRHPRCLRDGGPLSGSDAFGPVQGRHQPQSCGIDIRSRSSGRGRNPGGLPRPRPPRGQRLNTFRKQPWRVPIRSGGQDRERSLGDCACRLKLFTADEPFRSSAQRTLLCSPGARHGLSYRRQGGESDVC